MKKIITTVVIFTALSSVLISVLFVEKQKVPAFDEVKKSFVPSDIRLLDRNGEVLSELRVDPTVRRLDWVEYNNIPEHLIRLVIYAEDRRFLKHDGVDWLGMANAFAHAPFQRRGASTITMQTAAMVNADLKKVRRKSISQKIKQIASALWIEKNWSKEQILEAYFNFSFYKSELQGLDAASRGIFKKNASGLSIAESSILAASFQQPNAPTGRIVDRACRIATGAKMISSCNSFAEIGNTLNEKKYFIDKQYSLAPHVARQLLNKSSGNVKTTLNKNLQAFAIETVQNQLKGLHGKNANDAAVLVLDNTTGEVLAYVGNGFDEKSYYVDGIKSLRQAGSTFKPFLYGLAFEDRLLTPSSILNDSPLEIRVSGGMYRPKNYDDQFHGKVSVRTALGSSMNIPAVRAIQLVGVDRFVNRMKTLGFAHFRESTFYGPSFALGSADITLWELTNAYRTFANHGVYSEPTLVVRAHPIQGTQIFSDDVSFLIGNILSSANNRSLTFGMGGPLSGHSWVAVKTGTSKDMRDNWCIGYSSQYTVGVWVGNFSGEAMWGVSGVTGAAPIFSDVMDWLHQNNPSVEPLPPDGITQGAKNEWFLAGTESSKEMKISSVATPSITYPSNETIFAWDPDIPSEAQKIIFEAKTYANKWSWKLNKNFLGKASGPVYWSPRQNGHFELALVDDANHTLDKISFQVRGVPKND